MSGPPSRVLDLFAVPHTSEPLPGGTGRSVHAGDLVLSPGRDETTAGWLSPVVARLAVRLDERPGRRRRDLRIAVPVPARDGSWVVDGWAASRWEPDSQVCRDLDVVRATGRLLHAELASVVTSRPAELDQRQDRWARAERQASGPVAGLPPDPLVRRVAAALTGVPLGPPGSAQLVHADLAGNVLLDAGGAPVVIDVSPAWQPVVWADALCVLDGVAADPARADVLATLTTAVEREALGRALLFRLFSDPEGTDLSRYDAVVDHLLA